MKHFIWVLLLLSACTTTVIEAPKPPVVIEVPKPPVVVEAPKPIMDLAVGSSCAAYSWKNRSKAPIGYIKGMLQSYSRSYCKLKKGDFATKVMAQPIVPSNTAKDVLALYKVKADTEALRLRKLYTLLIGLGMRESSGWYGEGRDMSASWTASNTAETGLFQFSYNLKDVMTADGKKALAAVYDEYRSTKLCSPDVFKEGAVVWSKALGKLVPRTFNTKYWSLDSEKPEARAIGLAFQKFMRECPDAAVEYTAVGVRERVGHWGPAKRQEAEMIASCEVLLEQVEKNTVCAL